MTDTEYIQYLEDQVSVRTLDIINQDGRLLWENPPRMYKLLEVHMKFYKFNSNEAEIFEILKKDFVMI